MLIIFALSIMQLLAALAASEHQIEIILDVEITLLAEQYAQRGLSGLVQIVAARSAGDRGDAMVYLMTDPNGAPLAGNIAAWPAGVPARTGRLSFTIAARVKEQIENHPAQGAMFIIPGGHRLLVGRDISDISSSEDHLKATMVFAALLGVGVCFWIGIAWGNLVRDVEKLGPVQRVFLKLRAFRRSFPWAISRKGRAPAGRQKT
jgi:hypothetical protein